MFESPAYRWIPWRAFEAFERDRPLLGRGRFCEVRYEDLVADMPGQMRRIYETLELSEFDQVLSAIRQYAVARAGYQTNRYEIPPETRERISRRWAAVSLMKLLSLAFVALVVPSSS